MIYSIQDISLDIKKHLHKAVSNFKYSNKRYSNGYRISFIKRFDNSDRDVYDYVKYFLYDNYKDIVNLDKVTYKKSIGKKIFIYWDFIDEYYIEDNYEEWDE